MMSKYHRHTVELLRFVSEQGCSETEAHPEHVRQQELEVGERRHLIAKDFVHEVIISLLK